MVVEFKPGDTLTLGASKTSAVNLSGLAWNLDASGTPIILIHGWLDNAASFSVLGPLLARELNTAPVIAIDLPGHGKSPWKPDGGDYAIWNYTGELVEFITSLQGASVPTNMVAHSLGASVALCLAAAFSEFVKSLVILDSPGPLVTADKDFASQLRQGIQALGTVRESRSFENTQQAVMARSKATPQLSHGDIEPLVDRNLILIKGQGLQWSTDPRLKIASKVRMSEGQVKGLMSAVMCPVLSVRASEGIVPKAMFEARMKYLTNPDVIEIAGHHHCHMEPAVAQVLAPEVAAFLSSVVSNER